MRPSYPGQPVMKECGLLILVLLSLASLNLISCRTMQQDLEPDFSESALAGGNDITYEEGFTVQTVLEGSKMNVSVDGIVPAPGRDYIYVLDTHASQVLKMKLPVEGNQMGLVAGSADGETGHKDGWGKSSLFNHPEDLTVDDEGNVYVADVRNRVVRKINPDGAVTTIAGQSNVTGFADGEGSKARFSAEFGVTYISRICSLLVSDRGNRRLRLIRLKKSAEECNYQKGSFSMGLEGLFFVVSGTIMISTITVLVWKDAALRENLRVLRLVVANRLRRSHSGDDHYTPLPSDLIDLSYETPAPGVPSQTPRITDGADFTRRSVQDPAAHSGAVSDTPSSQDISFETPVPPVPSQTLRITDGADFTRGRVQDLAGHSEAVSDTPSSPATSLASDRDQAQGSQRLTIEGDRS